MYTLRPTVKRDLSVFSVFGWEQGYTTYLKRGLGWWYDIFFHYDGEKVNFYHRVEDFKYFKETVTRKLISDYELFTRLNTAFKKHIGALKKELDNANVENLPTIQRLMGKIMSLYIFIVSDDFVKERSEAWESRNMSEGILYEADKKVEKVMEVSLIRHNLSENFAHFLTPAEIELLATGKTFDNKVVALRAKEYIVFNHEIITSQTFDEFCRHHELELPKEDSVLPTGKLFGTPAYFGKVQGIVRIVKKLEDIKKVQSGDILVAIMTNVKYLPAMRRAAGIVTDEGGIASHAAITAREFKIPTVTGTKIATKVLKDGDFVEVDAEKGIVRKLP